MNSKITEKEFLSWKNNISKKDDFSKAGPIDKHLRDLCSFINDQQSFYSTSCCSGRIVIASYSSLSSSVKKNTN